MLIGIFSIVGIVMAVEGKWGPFAIAAGIVLLLVFMITEDGKDMRAYYNRRDYWAMDGKERARQRRKWEAEARMEEERARLEALERAERKRGREQRRLEKRALRERQEWPSVSAEKTLEIPPITYGTERHEIPLVTYRSGSSSPAQQTAFKPPYMAAERALECRTCGRKANSPGYRKNLWDGRVVTAFWCPVCRCERWN